MIYSYKIKIEAENQLQIDNPGECCIKAIDTYNQEYFLYVHSELGFMEIIQYGPYNPNDLDLPKKVSYTYERYEYNDKKLDMIIDKFLNMKEIETAISIDKYEMKNKIVNLIEVVGDEE